MLVSAMEVSGIEGTFRITCESVLRVLRENADSLMAVLEAFVYDPLINWRLLAVDEDGEAELPEGAASEASVDIGKAMAEATSGASGFKPKSVRSRSSRNRVSSKGGGPDAKPKRRKKPRAPRTDDAAASASPKKAPRPVEDVAESVTPESTPVGTAKPAVAAEEDGNGDVNARAVEVMARVRAKLGGTDFPGIRDPLEIPDQLNLLIAQATSNVGLATHYSGWVSYW